MNRTKTISLSCLFLSIALLLCTVGCAKSKARQGKFSDEEMAAIKTIDPASLPTPSGGLVLSVNTETITADEIIRSSPLAETLKHNASATNFQNFRKQNSPFIAKTILNKTTDILLYQKAKKTLPDNIDAMLERYVETEMNRFVVAHGGDYARARQAVNDMGMNWKEFRDYQRRLILTQNYISQELPEDKPIAHSEIVARYNQLKEEHFTKNARIKFSLIDINPSRHDLTPEAATQKAQQILDEINAGSDFAELATKHSDGHRAAFGGLWNPVTPGSLAEPYDILETRAQQMSIGEISGLIETDQRIFIMKLEEKNQAGYLAFEEVQAQLEQQIRIQRRNDEFDKIVSKLLKQADVANMDQFLEYCIATAYNKYRI